MYVNEIHALHYKLDVCVLMLAYSIIGSFCRSFLVKPKLSIITTDLDLWDLNRGHKCKILNWPLISHPEFDLSLNQA